MFQTKFVFFFKWIVKLNIPLEDKDGWMEAKASLIL